MPNTIGKMQQLLYNKYSALVKSSDEQNIDKVFLRWFTSFCGVNYGKILDDEASRRSTLLVDRIEKYQIDMKPFRRNWKQFNTVNDWFTRRLDYSKRPLPGNPGSIIAPADARTITFDKVPDDQKIWLKDKDFTVKELLGPEAGADGYSKNIFHNGAIVISRLAIQDYHCFHSPVNGIITNRYRVKGILHSVGVDAMTSGSHAIYNDRQIIIIDTDRDSPAGYTWMERGIRFRTTGNSTSPPCSTVTPATSGDTLCQITGTRIGKVAYVAIGAMCTGSVTIIRDGIRNRNFPTAQTVVADSCSGPLPCGRVGMKNEKEIGRGDWVTRGGFVGQMAFGGSTVATVFEPNRITIDQDLRFTSRIPLEQYVTVRQQMAMKINSTYY